MAEANIKAAIARQEPIIGIKDEAEASEAEYKARIKKLWRMIKDADADTRAKIINELDEKTVTDLRTFQNPYRKPVFAGDRYRLLSYGIINLPEKYAQRLAMTTVVGFLYRMLDEYEPEDGGLYPSENDPEFSNMYNIKLQEFEKAKPERLLRQAIEVSNAKIAKLRETDPKSPELIKEAQHIFVLRAKLLRYQEFYLNKDLVSLDDAVTTMTRDLKQTNFELKDAQERLSCSKSKHRRRVMIEEGRSAEIDALDAQEFPEERKLADIMRERKLSVKDMTKAQLEARQRWMDHILVAEDLKRPVKYFESEIDVSNGKIQTSTAKIADLEAKIAKSNLIQKDLEAKKAAVKAAQTALKSEFSKMFGVIGNLAILDVEVERCETTPEEHDQLANEVKAQLKISMTREEYFEQRRQQIEDFLNTWFKYNPDNHVRAGWSPDFLDPEKRPKTHEEREKIRKEVETKYCRSVVPPNDSFARLNRYFENNYQALRQATDDIYDERSDFEPAIVPYEVFEGKNPEAVDKAASEFNRKVADEVEGDIYTVRFGIWNIIAPFAPNLEKRDFFTKKNELIKRIIERNQIDQKEGANLMKQRQKKMKSKNEEQYGKHEMPEAVRKSQTAELEKHGAKSTDQLERELARKERVKIDPTAIPRDEEVSKQDELEIGVHHIKPEFTGRRRVRGRTEAWKFHIPTEKEEGTATVMTPSQAQAVAYKNAADEAKREEEEDKER